MIVSEAISGINYALRGIDDDAPTAGGDEHNYWLATLNRKKNELFSDASQLWSGTFKETAPNETGTVATAGTTTLTGTDTYFTDYRVGDTITVSGETVRTIATITSDTSLTVTVAFSTTASDLTFTRQMIIGTGVQSYSLHRSLLAPSDKAYVTTTAGVRVYFDIILPQERNENTQQVFISNQNPEELTFTVEILSTDSIVGGTLTLPGHYMPADLSAVTDILPFSDPYWGVMATASEIAFNDIIYETKAPDLNDKANALLAQMALKNRKGTYNNPRKMSYSVQRISAPTGNG